MSLGMQYDDDNKEEHALKILARRDRFLKTVNEKLWEYLEEVEYGDGYAYFLEYFNKDDNTACEEMLNDFASYLTNTKVG